MKRKPSLTVEQVEAIRADTVSTQLELATKYSVTSTTIYRIQRGLSHKKAGHVQASEGAIDTKLTTMEATLDTIIELLELLVRRLEPVKPVSITPLERKAARFNG